MGGNIHFLLCQLFMGLDSEPKTTEYFILYSYLLHYIRLLKIFRILPKIKMLRFRYLHGGHYTEAVSTSVEKLGMVHLLKNGCLLLFKTG